jgi:heterodisulfide reductase subunit A-like polyferredoxin
MAEADLTQHASGHPRQVHGNGGLGADEVAGAALVVGGGIGGMQAALDLAESGIKVFLAESTPAIGGTMAQLDKTFPTNDCAMCIMSPKLVDVGRHLNIQVITNSDLERLEGDPGSFQATLVRRPRYVRLDRCTGCGECTAACPIDRPDEFNWGLSDRKAVYKRYPQAIPNAYAIEKAGMSPCREACPIHQRAQGYVALIRQGRYADAYRTILEENPFPSICGRVCNHRCEEACSRGQVDAPVNIMALKRFVADWAWEKRQAGESVSPPAPQEPGSGKRVAIVGSGPAGLTCAKDLRRHGHEVTVFEALSVPGGMMRVGIPSFRLASDAVQREIDDILEQGIELRLNQRVEDLDSLFAQGFDAVFLAIGAHRGVRLPIPGAALPEVHIATDFLREGRLELEGAGSNGWLDRINGRRVLVLGGGNVAIDAAMTAKRFGAGWVGMACLEDRGQMPAHDWEVRDAEEEGIALFPARTFQEILSTGDHVAAVVCSRVEFRGFADGQPDFDVLPGTDEKIPADLVIFAIGQHPDSGWLREAVPLSRGRYPAVDPQTLATDRPGVFAGGDAVTGTSFVVDAVAAGHRAAASMDRYLHGAPLEIPEPSHPVANLDDAEAQRRAARTMVGSRQEGEKLPASRRQRSPLEFVAVLTEEQARAEAGRCLDCGVCSECLQCAFVCKADAIDHEQREEREVLTVGAVILAPGLEPIDPTVRSEFGYGVYPNVVTSLEFERMLSASGPWGGMVTRPSDGKHPRRVAWIQCVGSRQICGGQDYCSSICCMYATKEAIIAREHDDEVEPTIFYMDIRSHGKGFEEYIDRAGSEQGVRYVRSMVSSVKENPATGDLRLGYVTYAPDGRPEPHEETFDMVVLSIGLRPSETTRELLARLEIETDRNGFPEGAAGTGQTSRPGVFVAGTLAEPKDIPETVIEAGCVAAMVSEILASARGTLTRQVEFPAERDTTQELPRVGVFVCHCGINIGGVVDVPKVVEAAQAMPDVVYAERNLYTCSQDTQERIASIIEEQGLNRVVVASCTPRTHEALFQDTLRQAGLNPSLFEMANIREQDAWVHRTRPDLATQKATQLVAMAVAKAGGLEPIRRGVVPVEPAALVIGGGMAGMAAARSIADQGFRVVLVEREQQLGGQLRHPRPAVRTIDFRQLLTDTVRAVEAHPLIECLLGAEVDEVGGYVGQFHTRLRKADGAMAEVEHGAIVVATGGRAVETAAYGCGALPGVVTQTAFEAWLAGCDEPNVARQALADGVVMIQCVDSRQPARPYCSRVCCTEALQNALHIKAVDPCIPVTILYRDLRSYGFREALYRQAREQGVRFLQYAQEDPPEVSASGDGLSVQLRVQPEGMSVELRAGRVVLSTGIDPNPDNAALSQILKVPLTRDGFFLEAHAKLRPVDFAAEGVFVCGLAHSPRTVEESLEQGRAAAIRAVGLLSKPSLSSTPIVATVNPRLCSACGLCVETCPFGARQINYERGIAEVIEVLCQGCGACVAACPNKASQQRGFTFRQVTQMVEVAIP